MKCWCDIYRTLAKLILLKFLSCEIVGEFNAYKGHLLFLNTTSHTILPVKAFLVAADNVLSLPNFHESRVKGWETGGWHYVIPLYSLGYCSLCAQMGRWAMLVLSGVASSVPECWQISEVSWLKLQFLSYGDIVTFSHIFRTYEKGKRHISLAAYEHTSESSFS